MPWVTLSLFYVSPLLPLIFFTCILPSVFLFLERQNQQHLSYHSRFLSFYLIFLLCNKRRRFFHNYNYYWSFYFIISSQVKRFGLNWKLFTFLAFLHPQFIYSSGSEYITVIGSTNWLKKEIEKRMLMYVCIYVLKLLLRVEKQDLLFKSKIVVSYILAPQMDY